MNFWYVIIGFSITFICVIVMTIIIIIMVIDKNIVINDVTVNIFLNFPTSFFFHLSLSTYFAYAS